MSHESDARERHILGNALLVAAAFGLAAVMGLVRNMIIARHFGIGAELDAFYAAFKLPDLLFTIVAGGALATAFIPVFTDVHTNQGAQAAWRLASAITNLVVLVVSGLAVLAALFAPWLVHTLIAPGFSPALQAETAALMRLVLVSTIFFGTSAVQSSVLHSFKHFLLPALAPVVYPLGIVLGALWLVPLDNPVVGGVRGLAVGAAVGALLHLLVKVPALIHFGLRWWPLLELQSAAVRRVLVLMGPRVLDLGVFHLTLLATTNLASRLGPGAVSAVEWGWEFMQLPETIIGTAFGLVAFPTLADLAARRDMEGLRHALGDTLRTVITLTLPAAFGLILLGRPLVALLYERGEFDPAATEAVYVALRFFALGLVGHSCLELAARAYFALQDTITPLLIAVATGVLHVLLGVALMGPLGHGGLALANSLAITVEVLVLLWLLRGRLGGVEGRATLITLGRVALACAVMSGVVLLVSRYAGTNSSVQIVTGALCGGVCYGVTAWVVGVPLARRVVGITKKIRLFKY